MTLHVTLTLSHGFILSSRPSPLGDGGLRRQAPGLLGSLWFSWDPGGDAQ